MCNIIQNFNLIQWFWQQKADFSNTCRIFQVRGVSKCLGVRFWRVETNFTIGKALKFGNFSKICLRIIKNMTSRGENFSKMQNFHEIFVFCHGYGKIRIIIYVRYNGECSWASPISYKIFNNFIKKLNLLNLSNFSKISQNLSANLFKNNKISRIF